MTGAGAVVTTLATLMVWSLGEVAHIFITSASLALLVGVTLLCFQTRADGGAARVTLALSFRLGSLWMWLFVVVPGGFWSRLA